MPSDFSLWRADELVDVYGAGVEGELSADITGISIDSRTVKEGELFFAIAGDRFDGHDFVKKAFENGAAACVVRSDWAKPSEVDGILIRVDDVLEGLRMLARAARRRTHAKIIGITGSVGKTSTKDMLALALEGAGKTHTAVASFNNHWGVPLTLARTPRDVEFAVYEIGMNHAGEITPLSQLVQPHGVIITTIEAVHISAFNSVDEIAEAKSEIFEGLEPGGFAILNHDNRYFNFLSDKAKRLKNAKIVSFGNKPDSDLTFDHLELEQNHTKVDARTPDGIVSYQINAPGRHLAENSLALIGVLHSLGVDKEKCTNKLADWQPTKGRGHRKILETGDGKILLIDESYNANPVSVKAALKNLSHAKIDDKECRTIAVLGDMLELGEQSDQMHADLAEEIAEFGINLVCTAGPLMANLHRALKKEQRGVHAATSAELTDQLLDLIKNGDAIMVKGSLGSKMMPLADALDSHFSGQSRNST